MCTKEQVKTNSRSYIIISALMFTLVQDCFRGNGVVSADRKEKLPKKMLLSAPRIALGIMKTHGYAECNR